MKAQIIAAVAILAAVVSLESPVRAQSLADPSIAEASYKITGDSLEGIGTRTAEYDFVKFFEEPRNNGTTNNSANNNQERKSPSNAPRSNRSIVLPTDFLLLQPVQSPDIYGINGNYGLELQFKTEN